MEGLTSIDQRGDGYTIAHHDGCLIQHWWGNTSLAGAKAALATAERLARGPDERLGVFIGLEVGVALPDGETRALLTEVGRTIGERGTGAVLVYPGDGFYAAAVRSVVSGMQLLVKQRYPLRVMGQEDEAIDWLRVRMAPQAGELRQAWAEVRAVGGAER